MSKICAKCEKPVYPTEELKCLDKSWHKLCFKCWECGMSLNMKNYKGFDKKPYCSAHYPQQRATVVAETPEIQRLTQASKNQSQTAYHDEFEKSKGKYTQVADDPELRRVLKNQEIVSMAKYHEDFEKNIKGSKIQVVDDPETQRLKQLTSVMSEVEYKGLREKVSDMEARRNQPSVFDTPAGREVCSNGHKSSPYSDRSISHSVLYSGSGIKVDGQNQQRQVGSISDYEPSVQNSGGRSSGACRQEWEETISMPSAQNQYQVYLERQQQQQQRQQQQPTQQQLQQQQQQQALLEQQQQKMQKLNLQQNNDLSPKRNQPQQSPTHGAPQRPVYQAMYDYEAQDADEVGFKENDLVIDPEPIDDGWMYGTIQRTGQRGMLPSNYVERVQ